MTQESRRPRQELSIEHGADRRLRHARSAVPELRRQDRCENYRRYACTKCEFSLPKHPGSRTFEVEEVEQLLRDRTIGPLNGFISKMGRPFSAVLKITPELKIEFDFGQSNDGETVRRPDRLFERPDAAWAVPEVRAAACSSSRCPTCARTASGREKQLRLPLGQGDPAAADRFRADGASCWTKAGPICCAGSFPIAPGASSRRFWCASPTAPPASNSSRARRVPPRPAPRRAALRHVPKSRPRPRRWHANALRHLLSRRP